jgi:hypothetical protein
MLTFKADLRKLFPGARGEKAVKEWENLQEFMTPLAAASVALPPAGLAYADVCWRMLAYAGVC